MNDIITTKDLNKKELIIANILAVFVIIGISVYFLNVGRSIENSTPNLSFKGPISQATDGSGLISFALKITKIQKNDCQLKIEYSTDNQNYYQANLVAAITDDDLIVIDNGQPYQIVQIESADDEIILNLSWDTKSAANGNGSLADSQQNDVRIKATLSYLPKEPLIINEDDMNLNDGEIVDESEIPVKEGEPNLNSSETNQNSTEENIIDENNNEAVVDQTETETTPESDSMIEEISDKAADVVAALADLISEDAGNEIIDEIPENIDNSNQPAEPADSEFNVNLEDEELADNIEPETIEVISKKFKLDNLAPEISGGEVSWTKNQLIINFSENMDREQELLLTQIKLQEDVFFDSQYKWLNKKTLAIKLTSDMLEKYKNFEGDWVVQIDPASNLQDLYGNFKFMYINLTADEIITEEVEITNEDSDVNEEPVEEEVAEDKEEIEILPELNPVKKIFTRGYNKNCSFNPDDFVMSAGETRQTSLSLVPRDQNSKFIIAAKSLPKDFEVEILQPAGTGSGPVTVSVFAPANASPRLYKILLRYEDFTSQSVSYVNNCVLRLTVQ